MSNPFEKFKKQLNQNNNINEILDDEFSFSEKDNQLNTALEDSVIEQETVNEMNLTPKDESFQYVFFPKNDITTYDLARILAITQLMITPDIYEKFPDDLKKHFTTFSDLKN